MAFPTTALSSGSSCWSACARPASAAPSSPSSASGTEARADERQHIACRKLRALCITPVAVFELARIEAALRHHQPVRDPQQLRIGELDSRARVAVVVQDFDPSGGELGVQAFGDFTDTGGLLQVQRYEHHLERSDRLGPDDAA